MVENENAEIYKQAMKRIDELVEEVMQTCNDVALKNHYEPDWVLDRFRERFGTAKRKLSK